MTNIALVVLDTLRYDTFSKHFDWMPGERFTRTYSTSHWTIPAHASLLTGYYPSEVGVRAKAPSLDCKEPSLPELLHAVGYTTRMFSANLNIYQWDGWDRGFNQFVGPPSLASKSDNTLNWRTFLSETEATGYERYFRAIWECFRGDVETIPSLKEGIRMKRSQGSPRAEAILDRVQNTDFGDNEFLLINAMDTHVPYYPPQAYRSTDEPVKVHIDDSFANTVDNPSAVRRAYDEAAAYLSDTYQNIFATLLEDFDYVVTLADHGEMLGEHGRWEHGYGLYPELTHVPLVISGKELGNGVHDEVVSILDVHRTLVELANLEASSRGQDLLDSPVSHDSLVEYHGFFYRHKERLARDERFADQIEELDTPLDGFVTADGGYAYQTHDGGFQEIEAGLPEDLDAHLRELREGVERRSVEEEYPEIAPETAEQLKDLGYA